MKSCKLLIVLMLLLTWMGCGDKVSIEDEISRLESELAQTPNDETLQSLADLYQRAARNSKDPEEVLRYTWKQGEANRGLKQFDQATMLLASIYEHHPDSEYGSKALFLHAFILDEDLEDFDQAGQLYRQFLLQYPESDFHDDAQFLLENLGKTDEEILETLTGGK